MWRFTPSKSKTGCGVYYVTKNNKLWEKVLFSVHLFFRLCHAKNRKFRANMQNRPILEISEQALCLYYCTIPHQRRGLPTPSKRSVEGTISTYFHVRVMEHELEQPAICAGILYFYPLRYIRRNRTFARCTLIEGGPFVGVFLELTAWKTRFRSDKIGVSSSDHADQYDYNIHTYNMV
jgi:hypothetical protein